MKIVRLEAANVKRLRAVTIEPDPGGALVVIAGKNAQGKTSVLDSIAYALGGKKLVCEEPIRSGVDRAKVVVDLGELVVTRTWHRERGSELEVRSAESGNKMQSPQAVLDLLRGRISFDPLEFVRQGPKERLETLRKLVGLDFTEHEARRKTLYDDRTESGRHLRAAQARLDALPEKHAGVPVEEVSVVELSMKLEATLRECSAVDQAEEIARRMRTEATSAQQLRDRLGGEIETLKERHMREFAELQARQAKEQQRAIAEHENAITAAQRTDAHARAHEEEAVKRTRPDPDPIRAQIERASALNAKVRQNAERGRVEMERDAVKADVDRMTLDIDALDAAKAEQIQAAKFPVPGLSLDDHGVRLNGQPFEQASSAEQLRVSVAMGAALNPTLRVLLVREGSVLDDDSMKILAEMAAATDMQCWVERVGGGEDGAVVIHDGEVAG